MTGWRVGWLVTRADLGREARAAERVLRLACGDLRPDRGADRACRRRGGVRPHGRRLQGEPRFLHRGATGDARRHRPDPDGAFYVFPRSTASTIPSGSAGACSEQKVGLAPGLGFWSRRRGLDQALLRGRARCWSPPSNGWTVSSPPGDAAGRYIVRRRHGAAPDQGRDDPARPPLRRPLAGRSPPRRASRTGSRDGRRGGHGQCPRAGRAGAPGPSAAPRGAGRRCRLARPGWGR